MKERRKSTNSRLVILRATGKGCPGSHHPCEKKRALGARECGNVRASPVHLLGLVHYQDRPSYSREKEEFLGNPSMRVRKVNSLSLEPHVEPGGRGGTVRSPSRSASGPQRSPTASASSRARAVG